MEELTIEQKKAKLYDEALEAARCIYNNMKEGGNFSGMEDLEVIFPELKESEDERIKKAIIMFFELQDDNTTFSLIPKKDILTWLEKQGKQKPSEWNEEDYNAIEAIACHLDNTDNEGMGDTLRNIRDKYYKTSLQTNEHAWLYLVSDVLTWKDGIGQYLDDPRVQELAKKLCSEYAQKLYNSAQDVAFGQKPTNKVEPKFKVGDWIIQEYVGVYKVIEICKSWYEVIDDEDNHYSISFDKEGMCHLWTIDDAKEGDVLISSVNKPFIYNGYFDEIIVGAYCGLYINDDFVNANKEHYWTNNVNIRPATKEQHDILFKKMKENGYEWDSEKKEAIRIY